MTREARLPLVFALAALTFGVPLRSGAQISLSTAVDLSLRNSPKVRLAEADVARANAVLSETKDAYIPAVSTTAGVGKATGAPLEPPVIFSIAAQSLVFNSSQPDYVRAAHSGVDSAQLALEVARSDAAEDVTNTYIALDNALQRRAAEAQAASLAGRLVTIVEERFNAGVDAHMELTKARRTEAQIRLQQLLVEDEISAQAEHLARLTGLPAANLQSVHSSIPELQAPMMPSAQEPANEPRTQGISAAFAAAQAKDYTAHGERRYLFHPQFSFSANYSRISTAFTTYSQYYPQFGKPGNSLNSLGVGVQITVPLLDMVHRARAKEAEADAAHALFDAQVQQNTFFEGRKKLRHGTAELAARARIASLEHDLAQDQLDATVIRLRAAAGAAPGEQATPKDQQNAALDERLRAIDVLSIELQLRQAEVTLMRQEGSLSNWLGAAIPSAAAAPAAVTPDTAPVLPATVGTEPGGAPAPGTPAPPVPTTGTVPSSLPSSPVTNPAPTVPPSTPPTTPHI